MPAILAKFTPTLGWVDHHEAPLNGKPELPEAGAPESCACSIRDGKSL